MGWVTLTLRKSTLKQEINQSELRDIEISRTRRSVDRNLEHQRSIFENDKKERLNEEKKEYNTLAKDKRRQKKTNSDAYKKWETEFNQAKEDWEESKLTINNYYDSVIGEIEEEATDEEARLDEEKTTLEAQLEDLRSELEAVGEQISSDIDSSKLQLN